MAFKGLFIGVDRYASPNINWLNCATRDAQILEALFCDNLGNDTRLLLDKDATRSGIKAAFEDLQKCDEDDTVVISFSGHGSETHELITYDADTADLKSTAIPLEELKDWFAKIPSRRLVIFLDCCFSGGMGARVLHVDEKPRNINSVDLKLSELSGDGRLILTASSPTEAAWETQRYGHGLFTHTLISALQGPEEIVENGNVSVYQLIEFITKRVISAANQFGESQNPTMRGKIDGDLRWPVFENGPRYKALVADTDAVRVTENTLDLKNLGLPDGAVNALSKNIPSLNELQLDAINEFGVLRGEHLVVSAPTSSGKTMIGELAALHAVGSRKKAIFLFPLKALVADKLQYFEAAYGTEIKVIEATGETDDLSDLIRGRYDVALLTYEKFAAVLMSFPHVLGHAGVVVIDESQTLADNSRGANLEFLITLIRMRRREGLEPQLISLSAVIGDLSGFENWLGARLLRRTERPVPLDEGLLLGDGSNRYIDGISFEENLDSQYIQPIFSGKNSSQDFIIPLVRKLVSEGKQVIVFRETKGETRGCAKYLANALNLPPAQSTLDRLPKTDQSLASSHLYDALQGGVCFHNADLARAERLIIEEDFRKSDSKIRVIAATTTLAMGVNTPAAAVVVAGLMHPGNNPYTVAEYKNLVGRAGRLGFSEKGFSYLIAATGSDEHNYWHRYILGEPEDLQSRFLDPTTDTRSLIVKVLAASKKLSKTGMSINEVSEFLEA